MTESTTIQMEPLHAATTTATTATTAATALHEMGTPLMSNRDWKQQDSKAAEMPHLVLPPSSTTSPATTQYKSRADRAVLMEPDKEEKMESPTSVGRNTRAGNSTDRAGNSSPTSVATCMNGQKEIQDKLDLKHLHLPMNGSGEDKLGAKNHQDMKQPATNNGKTQVDEGVKKASSNGHKHLIKERSLPTQKKAPKAIAASTASAKFSSSTEEPITMSPDALRSVLNDVKFSEAQDTDAILLPSTSTNNNHTNIRVNTLSIHPKDKPTASSFLGLLFARPWDISYSTSSLTRHNYHNSPHHLDYWLGLLFGDLLQRLTLQRPLSLPFLLQRMLSLIWHRGPNQFHEDSDNRDNARVDQLQQLQHQPNAAFQLPPALTAVNRIFSNNNRSHRVPSVAGIPNYGQTCFLNVVLQSLASLDSVIAYAEWIDMEQLQQQQQQEHLNNSTVTSRRRRRHNKTPPTTTTVSQLLLPLLRSLNGQPSSLDDTTSRSNVLLDPRELLWRIAQKNPQFQAQRHGLFGFSSPAHSTGEQQDAQELLQALLEMMIVDAKLEEPKTDNNDENTGNSHSSLMTTDMVGGEGSPTSKQPLVKTPSQRSGMALSSMLLGLDEKKDEDAILHDNHNDEVLTVLSDRWSPRNSSNNSLAGDEMGVTASPVPQSVGTGTLSDSSSLWNHVQMVDSSGIISAYDDNAKKQPTDQNLSSSLASSFLSTTSTVVTSNSRDQQQPQQPSASSSSLSASMQIMLSTISSITKTPLSCWTGSLVKCETCRHNRAVRNQEWRDIPIVPTALRNPALLSSSNNSSNLPPCRLEECLANFTQVERVTDVECGNCTLQRDMQHWQGEVDLLCGAVTSLEQRRRKKGSEATNSIHPSSGTVMDEIDQLRLELETAEAKLQHLKQQDPDEYDPRLQSSSATDHDDDDNFLLSGTGETPGAAAMIRSNALKCLVLTRLPSVLCLHVQRRYYDPATDRMSKTLQHVVFEEMLDVAPYCAYGGGNINAQRIFADNNGSNSNKSPPRRPQQQQQQRSSPIWYRLASVIEHKGNAFGGHYVCYRRLPAHLQSNNESNNNNSNKWYYCSDDVVHLLNWNQVQRAQAYMLFYEAM